MSAGNIISTVRAVATLFVLGVPALLVAQVPDAPSDAEAIIRGENEIDVAWVDNSDNEIAFDIYRSDGGAPEQFITAVDQNLTLFQDRASGIEPGIEYCYVVRARNNRGSSEPSNQACVTIPPRPTSPSGLIASRFDNNSPIVLTWIDNAVNEDGFIVYRDTRGTGFVLIDTVEASLSRFEDKSVRENGQYCYFVSAFNVTGESQGSNQSCLEVTVGDPALPTRFEVEPGSGSAIGMSWAFDFLTHSELYIERSVGTSGPWTEVFRTPGLDSSYVDTGLNSDTEYCYRLQLLTASGSTAATDPQCSRTDFVTPPVPRILDAVGFDDRSILVSWATDPSPQVKFVLERRIGLGGFTTLADSLDVLEYRDSGLDDRESYCYRVKSFNPKFESGYSSTVCSIVAPSPVANLTLTPGPTQVTRELTASWQQGPGAPATSFEVAYRPVGSTDFSTPTVTNSLRYSISGLDDATEYEVRVVSFKAVDTLSASSSAVFASASTFLAIWPGDIDDDGTVTANDVVILTGPDCYGKSSGLSSSDSLDVSWMERGVDPSTNEATLLRCDTDRTGIVNIFDFLAIAANAGREVQGKAGNEVSEAPVGSAEHLGRIRQIYDSFAPESGHAGQSQLKSDLGEILRKAESELIPDRLRLGPAYPNPAQRVVHLELAIPSDATVRLTLVDLTGRRVRTLEGRSFDVGRHDLRIETEGLPSGLYFVVLESEHERLIQSLVVAR